MTVKVSIVLVLLVIIGGVFVIKISEESKPKRPDFFKNDLSKIQTDDGQKF